MSPAWFGCADRARLRDDPMIGSAPYARGWLLIEHPGPWAIDALHGSGIRADILTELANSARSVSARILLVRRPGRQPAGGSRSWIAIGSTRTAHGTWIADDDLRTAASTLRRLAVEAPTGPVRPDPVPAAQPIIAVCTHGIHDTCCAVRGRPVAAALAERWPGLVWECSHLGGDRFAANVVVFPDAAYYGGLDAQSAVEAVSDHLAGRVPIRWLRGLARYAPPAQAAVAEAHRRFGPLPPDAITAGSVQALDDHHWRVSLGTGSADDSWTVLVSAERREPAVLTCRAASATPATSYLVTEFTPTTPTR